MESYKEVWSHTLNYLRESENLSSATFNIWFKELKMEGMTDSYIYLSAEKQYKAEFVFNMYYEQIKDAVFQTLGKKCDIILFALDIHTGNISDYVKQHIEKGILPEKAFCKIKESVEYLNETPLSEEEKKMIDEPRGALITSEIPPMTTAAGIVEEYTFDNFIVGKANKYAHDACYAVAHNIANTYYPLLIYSPSGMGKTHLLYAICNEIVKANKGKRVLYVKGSDFSNELVDDLIFKKPMRYFREKYRNVDVLLVDDIQFIAGKESIQEEFFHTFNALYEQNKQIILASDRPPRDMKNLESRLRSRFESGLMLDIQPPELELRVAIAKAKAQKLGLEISDEAINFIAENIKTNIRQLEGVINNIKNFSSVFGYQVDMELVKKCMNDVIPKESIDNTVQKTFDEVCNFYKITFNDLISKKRNAKIVIARHVSTYILRNITSLSSIEIARYFSQIHTSVLSAVKNVEEKIAKDPDFEEEVNYIISKIKE